MGPELKHDEVEELLGAYALGAVPADELEAVERHVADCPRCRAEVAEHLQTAAMLGAMGSDAPEGVWDRISGVIGEVPTSLDRERPRRRAWQANRWVPAAAAAAVVLAVSLLGVKVVQQDRRIEDLATTSERGTLYQAAAQALLEEDARIVTLRSPVGDSRVDVVLLEDGTGYLIRDNLRSLPDHRTYQLWALVGDEAISAGVLGTELGIAAFRAPTQAHGLAITVEAAGGVPSTTKPPVVLADVQSS